MSKSISVHDLAALCGGTVLRGDAALVITGVNSIIEAVPGEVTFLGNRKYNKTLKSSHASAALVPADFDANSDAAPAEMTLIGVENPTLAFSSAIHHFCPVLRPFAPGVHSSAVVAESAVFDRAKVSIAPNAVIEDSVVIGDGSSIGSGVFIGSGARVGRDCVLHANAVVKDRCILGDRVIIHSCAIIGSDGFGYEIVEGRHTKIEQVGIVQLDDDVEIGSCTTIDRARFGKTWIGEGTKIDNLVQIAHNVVTGKHCIIVSQVGISGSTKLGNFVVMGGQVGVAGHLTIGDRVSFMAKSGVAKDYPEAGMYTGFPAKPLMEGRRMLTYPARVPDLLERVRDLEKKIAEIAQRES